MDYIKWSKENARMVERYSKQGGTWAEPCSGKDFVPLVRHREEQSVWRRKVEEGECGGKCGRRRRQKPDHVGHAVELALYSNNKGVAPKGCT